MTTRVGVYFPLLIFFCWEITLLDAQKCTICQARDFSHRLQQCICPDDQFCDTNKNCAKCDECYYLWKPTVHQRKDEIENILENLIKRYEINLNELQKLLKTLTDNVKKRQNELVSLNKLSDEVQMRIPKVLDDIKKLQYDVHKAEDELKRIAPMSVHDIVEYLKKIRNTIKNIVETLKNFKFEVDTAILDLNEVQNITRYVTDMKKNFPTIDKDSLNLALSVESDIDLLESIISKFGGGGAHGHKPRNTEWIEKDLLWLFSILNNYQNGSYNTDALSKNASNARESAEKTQTKLGDLLEKHETFEKRLTELKSETKFYKEIQDSQNRLRTLKTKIRNFENYLQKWRTKMELAEELRIFFEEREKFTKTEKKIARYKPKLDKLLQEEEELLIKYDALRNVKPIDEIVEEIKIMREEAKQIGDQVAAHSKMLKQKCV